MSTKQLLRRCGRQLEAALHLVYVLVWGLPQRPRSSDPWPARRRADRKATSRLR